MQISSQSTPHVASLGTASQTNASPPMAENAREKNLNGEDSLLSTFLEFRLSGQRIPEFDQDLCPELSG
ncbi:hypothetical protein VNO77_21774 [Canavalia gladiata]|uniref:Uncharacterized protein n=1 Tax=Canavalia gladiata TaxID=3824 RepID=A0AAN9L1K9_CANGL